MVRYARALACSFYTHFLFCHKIFCFSRATADIDDRITQWNEKIPVAHMGTWQRAPKTKMGTSHSSGELLKKRRNRIWNFKGGNEVHEVMNTFWNVSYSQKPRVWYRKLWLVPKFGALYSPHPSRSLLVHNQNYFFVPLCDICFLLCVINFYDLSFININISWMADGSHALSRASLFLTPSLSRLRSSMAKCDPKFFMSNHFS